MGVWTNNMKENEKDGEKGIGESKRVIVPRRICVKQ